MSNLHEARSVKSGTSSIDGRRFPGRQGRLQPVAIVCYAAAGVASGGARGTISPRRRVPEDVQRGADSPLAVWNSLRLDRMVRRAAGEQRPNRADVGPNRMGLNEIDFEAPPAGGMTGG